MHSVMVELKQTDNDSIKQYMWQGGFLCFLASLHTYVTLEPYCHLQWRMVGLLGVPAKGKPFDCAFWKAAGRLSSASRLWEQSLVELMWNLDRQSLLDNQDALHPWLQAEKTSIGPRHFRDFTEQTRFGGTGTTWMATAQHLLETYALRFTLHARCLQEEGMAKKMSPVEWFHESKSFVWICTIKSHEIANQTLPRIPWCWGFQLSSLTLKGILSGWANSGYAPIKELRVVAGKCAWLGGVLPRSRCTTRVFYAVLSSQAALKALAILVALRRGVEQLKGMSVVVTVQSDSVTALALAQKLSAKSWAPSWRSAWRTAWDLL